MLIYAGIRVLLYISPWIPWRAQRNVSRGLVAIAWPFLGRHLKIGRSNLALVFADKGSRWRETVLRDSVVHLIWSGLEIFRLCKPGQDPLDRIIRVHGQKRVDEALGRGKGIVHVTAHLGNWELLVLATTALGYPCSAIHQKLKDPRLDKLLVSFLEDKNIRVVQRGESALPLIRSLARGELLGILADMDTDVESVSVPFMGFQVRAPVGPVRLAKRTGCPLIPAFIVRGPDGRSEITYEDEISVSGDEGEAVAAYTAAIEKRVRDNKFAIIFETNFPDSLSK